MTDSRNHADSLRTETMRRLIAEHSRAWRDYHYIYPVISRRSHGLSIGVNVNVDKACNFDCVYCCVDRTVPPLRKDVNLDELVTELDRMLHWVAQGDIWDDPFFAGTAPAYRTLHDIAFSGDGEPTAYPRFDEAVQRVADLKVQHQLPGVEIVIITNATLLNRPRVITALHTLDQNNGHIWAKLDAGTESYYKLIDRAGVPLATVLSNILECGRARPIVIQSLMMAVHGEPIPDSEFRAYLDRIGDLLAGGCRISAVQLYTTARQTAEKFITPLSDAQMDQLAATMRSRFPDLAVEVYYGV